MGRDAAGVIGIRLARKGDQVVGMGVVPARQRHPRADRDRLRQARRAAAEFRPKHRGSQGVRLISLEGAKTGPVAAVELVDETRRGAAAHLLGRPGRPHRRQEHQPLRQRGTRRHRHAPERRRHGGRHRRLPGGLGGTAPGRREWRRRAGEPGPGRRSWHRHDRADGHAAVNAFGERGAAPARRGARPLLRQRQPAARQPHRALPRHGAGLVRGLRVRQREHLRAHRRQRPREGRLPRAAHLPAGPEVDHGAAHHDRRLQARQRRAHHGRGALLLVRTLRQEGPAAGAHHGPPHRRHDQRRGRRPAAHHGPPPGPDPGLLQHPRRRAHGRPPALELLAPEGARRTSSS